ncbi:MAG: tetratricopeptide repeat protein [Planctomycetota bacterium]
MPDRPRRNLFLIALGGLAVLLAGCSSAPEPLGVDVRPEVRFREAMRLTAEGEKARADGNTRRAINYFRAAVATYPDIAIAQNNLGLLLLNTTEAHLGAKHLLTAAEIEPTDPRPLTNLAYAYWERNWTSDALRYYDMALERDPNDLGALRGSVRAAEAENRAERSDLDNIQRASFIERDPIWVEYFERQKFRVENQIRLRERADPTLRRTVDRSRNETGG